MISPCVRTPHKLANISVQAKYEWPMVSWGRSKANHSYPGQLKTCYMNWSLLQHCHTFTAPSMLSPCARTTHKFANIEVQAKSEWPTYGGRMVKCGGSNANHYCPGMLNTCHIFSRYTGSQHSHTIPTPSMPIPCARTTHKLASISAQAKSEILVANLWKENISWAAIKAIIDMAWGQYKNGFTTNTYQHNTFHVITRF